MTEFDPPLQLALTIPDTVSNPNAVRLFTYRAGVGWLDACAEAGNSCHVDGRQLNVGLSHLSNFAMVVPKSGVYLPIILRGAKAR